MCIAQMKFIGLIFGFIRGEQNPNRALRDRRKSLCLQYIYDCRFSALKEEISY
jgi:hypothetical protein